MWRLIVTSVVAGAALTALAGSPLIAREPATESFRVGVEGLNEQKYQHLGKGTVGAAPAERGGFRVAASASIKDPRNSTVYSIDVDMAFLVDRNRLYLVKQKSRRSYNDQAIKYQEQIEALVPFVYFVKFMPFPGPGDEPSRTYRLNNVEHELRYLGTGDSRQMEVALVNNGQTVGRYLVCGDDGERIHRLVWFRFYPADGRPLRFTVVEQNGEDRRCAP
ncbi:MAG: hypothetical protein HY815_33885 [Candidatus Riflebacteria bacterium]|nr:hypothetical protein [Candidatus Riflebacteria bacterium]